MNSDQAITDRNVFSTLCVGVTAVIFLEACFGLPPFFFLLRYYYYCCSVIHFYHGHLVDAISSDARYVRPTNPKRAPPLLPATHAESIEEPAEAHAWSYDFHCRRPTHNLTGIPMPSYRHHPPNPANIFRHYCSSGFLSPPIPPPKPLVRVEIAHPHVQTLSIVSHQASLVGNLWDVLSRSSRHVPPYIRKGLVPGKGFK